MSARIARPPWPMSRGNLARLENKKYRQRWGLYILEGTAAIRDALEAGAPFHGILVDDRLQDHPEERELIPVLHQSGVAVQQVPASQLKRISGLVTPPPMVGVFVEEPPLEPQIPSRDPLILALDRVQDPGNAGTLMRTAAFYGVRELWFGKGTVERYNPKVLRAAMSAHFQLRIAVNVDLEDAIRRSKKEGCRVFAADAEGEDRLAALDESHPAILLLGNEPNGVDPALLQLADARLAIARRGRIDSLNVAMAGAILLDRLLTGRNS